MEQMLFADDGCLMRSRDEEKQMPSPHKFFSLNNGIQCDFALSG